MDRLRVCDDTCYPQRRGTTEAGGIKALRERPYKRRSARTSQIAEKSAPGSSPRHDVVQMRILVTGASGFAGALIVPRLIAEGHTVRALARNAGALSGPAEAVGGDALTGSGLERALDAVEVAYYLIHSMERAPRQARFDERERVAAENFAAAASRAGVARIVYLGGMLPANGAAPEQPPTIARSR